MQANFPHDDNRTQGPLADSAVPRRAPWAEHVNSLAAMPLSDQSVLSRATAARAGDNTAVSRQGCIDAAIDAIDAAIDAADINGGAV